MDRLVKKQLKLEEQMRDLGIARYNKEVKDAQERTQEDQLGYGDEIVRNLLEPLTKAVKPAREPQQFSGSPPRAIVLTEEMKDDVLAYLTLREVVAGLSRPVSLNRLAVRLGRNVEVEKRITAAYDREEVQALVEKANLVDSEQQLAYTLRNLKALDGLDDWAKEDALKVGVFYLDVLTNHPRSPVKVSGRYMDTEIVNPTHETQELMRKRIAVGEIMRPKYLPMFVPPRPWTAPNDGGYLTEAVNPLNLVKVGRKGLEKYNGYDLSKVYKSLNFLQETPWEVNLPVYKTIKKLWENPGDLKDLLQKAGLPGTEVRVMPEKPETDDKEVLKEWFIVCAGLERMNQQDQSKRIMLENALETAKQFEDEVFYIPHQLDWRGRLYAVPQFSIQSPDFIKAMLQFGEGLSVDAKAERFHAIHGASCYGLDKKSFDERVEWVEGNSGQICGVAADPIGTADFWLKADSPFQFLGFCFDHAEIVQARLMGVQHKSKLPIAFDGSNSGLQHFSAMLRDPEGGSLVNLVDSAIPADVYKAVSVRVAESATASSDPEAAQWLAFGIDRKVCKRATMTYCYSVTQPGVTEQLMNDFLIPAYDEKQRGLRDFPFDGRGFKAACWMSKAQMDGIKSTVVKAAEAMDWLKDITKKLTDLNQSVQWVTPLGFPVELKELKERNKRVELKLRKGRGTFTIKVPTDALNPKAQQNGISPDFVHSLDAAHMGLSMLAAADQGITMMGAIHDSWLCRAGDAPKVFRIIRETFVDMYESTDPLQAFASSNAQDFPPPPPRGKLDLKQVLGSSYAFA